ncbi:MAG: hypothetical protein DMF77_05205 [Acidobacteria bacterium]|nr:MAG: hypothetical protein DMF77_05205 [Acidobacteriota bacterium]
MTSPAEPPSTAAPSTTAPAEPSPAASPPAEPYDVAHARVQEDRGQAMGLAARVTVPAELQHYSDRRRFLAVQMADTRQEQLELPQDDGDLAAMLRAGKLVELPPLGEDYILYDIGLDASDDPMAAYDPDAHKDVPLFASAADLDAERTSLADLAKESPSRRMRASAETRLKTLASYYDDSTKREALLKKGSDLTALAADFGGRSYDLKDPAQRAQLDERLLSLIRPGARDLILELAREYHQRFGRLLPISSLVRTERYQRRLGRVNANATKVEFPPHTTGCAFDISYRYMAADEQQFLMDRIAQLERDGKVEALKERRNHIHVFVFPDGQRPPDELVAQFLDEVDASHGIVRDASGAIVKPGRRAARGARAR